MQPISRILSVLLFIFCTYSVSGQVVAGFTATPLSGCAPLVVSFTNTTVPATGTTYVWDMGNGTGPVTLTDPGASYLVAGTYTVTLTAHHGLTSSSYSRIITVYPAPVVSFSAADTQVCPGVPVVFTGTVTPGVSGPVSYLWSSGDGYTSTASSYTHAYSLSGNFNVSLNVTNSVGCSAILTRSAYVHVFTPPVPAFTVGTRYICHPPGTATYSNLSTGDAPMTYAWSFGDGSTPSSLDSPAHVYTASGIYATKLVVTDVHGCKDSLSVPGYIRVGNLTAAFTGPAAACVYAPVTFSNTSSSYLSGLWLYGDGGTDTAHAGHHTYTVRDTFTVKLVVSDSFCHDTATHNIVIPDPHVSFHITPDTPCPAPVVAAFAATVPVGSTVLWDFGDTTSGSGISTSHTYTDNGFKTVSMYATSPLGCTDTVSGEYRIYDMVFAEYGDMPFGGCVPLTVNYTASATTTYPRPTSTPAPPYPYLTSYLWQFSDGSSTPAANAMHTYTVAGLFTYTVSVMTANGCTMRRVDTQRAGTPPVVTFSATPTHACYHDNEILFTRTVLSGSVNNNMWLFGEGGNGYQTFDTVSVPVYSLFHHFSIPGLFSDTLISFYNGCPDTFIRHDYILIDSPRAALYPHIICSLPFTASFGNRSMGADTHLWIFGDGTTSVADSPVHTFPGSAIYPVQLATYNIASGCRDTAITYVDLVKPVVAITASDTTVCKDDSVVFSTTLLSGLTTYYLWYAGGSYGSNYTNNDYPKFIDTFHTPGLYTIRVVAFDGHLCPDTITKTNYILVAKPAAHFNVSPASICWPQVTAFTDVSTDQPGATITNRTWAFGDGATATTGLPAVSHSYTSTGTYTITEIVTDNVGCKDTTTLTRAIFKPKASFVAGNTHPCRFVPVTFTNTSAPLSGTYLWSFGDGNTSILSSPVHAYADTGHFTVRLIVTDTHGCKDTANYVSYIVVTGPYAAFSMDDSVSVCPPFVVHFTNASSGGISNNWDLGNGGTSVATNPTNIYTVPGYDTVRLVVVNSFGCTDTAIKHVKVFGYAGAFSYSTDSGCAPLTVLFSADLSNVSITSSIIWDFADGVISSPALSDTITHAYLLPGAYVPRLILTDDSGCVSSSLGKDTIRVDMIRPGFTAAPNPVCVGDTQLLADTSSSYLSSITGRLWRYHGSSATLPSVHITYTAPGTYTDSLTVTDAWGCTAIAVKDISVYVLPAITSVSDSVMCAGGTVLLADSAVGGTWSSGNTSVASVDTSSGNVTGISAGIAPVTYSVGPTCFTVATVTVNAIPDPGSITGDTTVCVGAVVTLSDTVSGGIWTMSNGNATITSSGLVTGVSPGIDTASYTVTRINCSATATVPIFIHALPYPGTISGRDTLCKNGSVILSESVPGGIWSTGDPSVAVIDTAGNVTGTGLGTAIVTYVTAPDTNGCTSFITFPVVVINADFTINGNVTGVSCFDKTDGSITVSVSGGTPPFSILWSTGDSSYSIGALAPGRYSVHMLETANQCELSDSFVVTAPDSFHVVADIKNDLCFRSVGSISLSVTGGTAPYRFIWSNNATGNPITGLRAGNYHCALTDINGCATDVALVLENAECHDIVIFNAISPNGDGINDTWIIEGLQNFPNNQVQVFDKWGDVVYEQSNYNNDWAGMGKKGEVPDGTYYYLVKLNATDAPNGKGEYTGSLLIKR